MKKLILPVLVLAVIVFAACNKKASPAKTVAATTFNTDVHQLITAKCSPCHIPSKGGRKADLDNYGGAFKYATDMVRRIELNPTDRGFMPFKNPKLSPEEIAVFKKWVADGAPEK
jgi:hypothetical protein